MPKAVFVLALALSVLCGWPAKGQEPRTRIFHFEGYGENTLPDGFQAGMTGTWKATERSVRGVDGTRSTLVGKNLDVAAGRWHELKLRARRDVFTAYFNGQELFSYKDRTFTEAGAFGLWSKPNNVTYFDDLKAEIVE